MAENRKAHPPAFFFWLPFSAVYSRQLDCNVIAQLGPTARLNGVVTPGAQKKKDIPFNLVLNVSYDFFRAFQAGLQQCDLAGSGPTS